MRYQRSLHCQPDRNPPGDTHDHERREQSDRRGAAVRQSSKLGSKGAAFLANSQPNPYIERDPNPDNNPDRNADTNSNRDGLRYAYSDRNSNEDRHGYTHTDQDRDSDCDCNANRDPDANCHADCDADGDRDGYIHTDQDRDPDCDCNPDCDVDIVDSVHTLRVAVRQQFRPRHFVSPLPYFATGR
ncbi:MAG: hypothetical protein WA740_10700 [Candidatus Binataceae bacterium]